MGCATAASAVPCGADTPVRERWRENIAFRGHCRGALFLSLANLERQGEECSSITALPPAQFLSFGNAFNCLFECFQEFLPIFRRRWNSAYVIKKLRKRTSVRGPSKSFAHLYVRRSLDNLELGC